MEANLTLNEIHAQFFRPFTVVLEAPSCGIGKQLKIAFKNSMLVLLQLLKEVGFISNKVA